MQDKNVISGIIFYKGRLIEGCIEIENGIIKDIKKFKKNAKHVKGLILPAGIDVHVHFRDFRERYKETIESGSLSALYGGICLVVDQPNTNPPVLDHKVYLRRMEIARRNSYVDYSLNIGLTEDNKGFIIDEIEEIEKMYRIPAIGEVFLEHRIFQVSYDTLRFLKETIRDKKIITVHAEDPNLIRDEFRPKEAEVKAVKKCLEIGGFYFCHVSTNEALNMIYSSNSFSEVTPHHLLLSDRLVKFRVNPPLRCEDERRELFKNIHKADVIASDHAPHTIEEKRDGLPGFPGVEVMYPILMYLVKIGQLDLSTLVERISINPARIFNFKKYGGIEVGNYANLAVFDLSDVKEIKADSLHSKAGWTPYEKFKAIFPKKVFIRGYEVFDGEPLVKKGFGQVLSNQI